MFIKAQDLIEGNHIALDAIAEEVDHDIDQSDAIVEYVSIEGENVRIVTNEGSLEVPINFTVLTA